MTIMTNKTTKIALLGTSLSEFKALVSDLGLKPFVAKQVFEWVYTKKKLSWDSMVNLSKETKRVLETNISLTSHKKIEQKLSKDNETIKLIITLEDGAVIESVILKEKDYYNLCISSQCGCPVDCKFCVTGILGFKRNLTAAEIVEQVLIANQYAPISHLVFMGMGEPLLNYDNVVTAIDSLTNPNGFNISKRKITVSTSGFIKTIDRLIEEERFLNLAFSVGSAIPERREPLMPLEKQNPIMKVAERLHHYLSLHNRKLTLEYTLIEGKNDSEKDITALIHLAKYLRAKINLINLNPHPSIPFNPISNDALHTIKQHIDSQKIPVTIRFKRGQDIAAACGQLGG